MSKRNGDMKPKNQDLENYIREVDNVNADIRLFVQKMKKIKSSLNGNGKLNLGRI